MSIHSMPNNKKFEDNYDRIFGKTPAPYMPDRYFRLVDRVWSEARFERVGIFIPGDLYILKSDTVSGFTMNVAPMHCEALDSDDLLAFMDAMEYCSRYQPS